VTSAGAERTTGVFTVDENLLVVSWDDWVAEVTGVPASEARGRYLSELFPELIDRGMIDRLRRVVEGGRVDVLATAFHQYLLPVAPRNPRSSFDRMRQFVTMAPRELASGPGVVVTIEDVTDRFETDEAVAADISHVDERVRLRAVQRIGDRPDPSIVAGAFGDASWRVRREAADAIARSTDEHAVRTLIAAIRERHQDLSTLNASLTALANSAADVVGPISALLDDPDHDVRTYAALALGMLGDHRAAPALVARLGDPNDNVRFHVLEALGRIGDRSTADIIAAVAETRDFSVAFAALDALAAIGEPSVAHRLLSFLDDDLLVEPAVTSIGLLANEEVVGPLMQSLDSGRGPVRTVALAIERIHDRLADYFGEGDLVADLARASAPEHATERLLGAFQGANDEELHALVTVLGWLRGPGIDARLAPLLSHAAVGPHVADVLGRRGIDAAPEIMAAGRDFSGDSRRLAAVALRRIAWDVTTPLLISWLDDDPPVVVSAAGALGAIGDSRAFYPLLRILGHSMATVREAAVSALHSIGHPDMPAVIATRLADPQPEVREAAARVAGYFGYQRSLERMIGLASDQVPSVRRVAVEALANYEDRTAWVTIANAAGGDPDPSVRAAAIRACRDPRRREVDTVLQASLEDPNLWVRYQGIRALSARALGTDKMPPWLAARLTERARTDSAPPVRIAAFEALAELRIERALPVLVGALADLEPDIVSSAASALGAFDVDESRVALLGLLERENPQVVRAAMQALGMLRESSAVAPICRIAATVDDALTRGAAIAALGAVASAESTRALISLLSDRDCRADASRVLADVTGESLDAVIQGLQDPDASIRCSVIEILGRVKRSDLSRAVSAALDDSDQSVRSAAEQALTRRDLRAMEQAITAAQADANPTVRSAAASVVERK
jgi:HEAT repeat protein